MIRETIPIFLLNLILCSQSLLAAESPADFELNQVVRTVESRGLTRCAVAFVETDTTSKLARSTLHQGYPHIFAYGQLIIILKTLNLIQ